MPPDFEAVRPIPGSALKGGTRPDLLGTIERYWSARAEAFGRTRDIEWQSERSRWAEELLRVRERCAPEGRTPRLLDAGTGTGFFALLGAESGFDATGIDLSPEMIREARGRSDSLGLPAGFRVMRADRLGFADGTFDAVVSRNLVWTLPDAPAAYREWQRVLRPGGWLLIFDADYGAVNFSSLTDSLRSEGVGNAHEGLASATISACDRIKNALSVSRERRPAWDADFLRTIGFEVAELEPNFGEDFSTRAETWNPVPIFRLLARKVV